VGSPDVLERLATLMYVPLLRGEVQASRTEPDVAWRARAVTPARALVFRVDDWFDLLEEHFEMVRSTLAALSIRRETLLDGLA
jgi:hypothetical protein